jgi:hypothetical protein
LEYRISVAYQAIAERSQFLFNDASPSSEEADQLESALRGLQLLEKERLAS